jgi:stress-induced-phosphoprotein 1
LDFDHNNVKALAKKGNCYLMLKEYHKAMSAFEEGLKVDSKNAECLDGMQKT